MCLSEIRGKICSIIFPVWQRIYSKVWMAKKKKFNFRGKSKELWEYNENEKDKMWNSQVTSISFDALCGTEALSVVGIAHTGMAIAFTGWKKKQNKNIFFILQLLQTRVQNILITVCERPLQPSGQQKQSWKKVFT